MPINNETRKVIAQNQHWDILIQEVFAETNAQLDKWNVQDHPMGTGPDTHPLANTDGFLDLCTGRELEKIFRDKTEANAKAETLTYWDILLEEVFEAGAATGEELETELTQVAAVVVSMIAASRRARQA